MKLGVITDCFKRPLDDSIRMAADLGFAAVQIYATEGEFSPWNLSEEKKKYYKELLAACGLSVSALCADMGGHGFAVERECPARIEKTCRIADLAHEFGASVITTHIGVIPSDKSHPRYDTLRRALTACGEYASSIGVMLAIETGPENPETLLGFLEDIPHGVGVNLDPANLVMVTGADPAAAVRMLRERIVHTHLKDGKMLRRTDPEIIYNHFATGGIEALNVADYFLETPLGEGDVDFADYFAALSEIDYDGYLTIERETGKDPAADIMLGRDFVKTKFPQLLR